MLNTSALVAFVGVGDLEQARRFYGDALRLELRDEAPFALVAEIGGTTLRITHVPEQARVGYTVLGWEVTDIDAVIDELSGRDVVFTRYDGMEQDERGIWTSPSGARVAWFTDPDGNNLSLTEPARDT